jgi:hypothetical protein
MTDKLVTVGGGKATVALSTDGTLAGNSDSAVSTQKAVKTYVDARATAGVSTDGTLGDNSDTVVPSEKAVKTYVDGKAADVRAKVQELTASGAVTPGVNGIELNHATVAIAATIADLAAHPGLLVVKNTSPSGTAGHTVTAAAGTWDGTNDVITLNAPSECLVVWIDSNGNGTIVENIGAVGLS